MTKLTANGPRALPLWVRVALLIFNTAFGAWVGYFLGFAPAYYVGDHGDVGSAAFSVCTLPVGILAFSWLAFVLTKRGLRGLGG